MIKIVPELEYTSSSICKLIIPETYSFCLRLHNEQPEDSTPLSLRPLTTLQIECFRAV